ncbi:MAG: hypothetical protein HFE63_06875 [Clostridiales bacterium]|nr:hypothetical protein [Clostridiales bacterium]
MTKRTISFVLALIILTLASLSSCDDKKNTDEIDTLLTHVFAETEIKLDDTDDVIIHGYIGADDSGAYFLGNTVFTESGISSVFIKANDGKNEYIHVAADNDFSGNITAAQRFDGGFAYTGNGTYLDTDTRDFYLTLAFDNGQVKTVHHIDKLFSQNMQYISNLALDSDGAVYISCKNEVVILSPDLEKEISLTLPYEVNELCAGDGRVYALARNERKEYSLYLVDRTTQALGEPFYTNTTPTSINGAKTLPIDDGSCFVWDEHCVYTYNRAKNTYETMFNFANSGIAGTPSEIHPLADGKFILSYNDLGKTRWGLFEPTDDIDISDRTVIRIATLGADFQIAARVQRFNRTHPECYMIYRDYSTYNTAEAPDAGDKRMYIDISSGSYKPDIICGNIMNQTFVKLIPTFANLDGFMERDSELTKDSLIGCIRRSYSVNSKLYALPDSCTISTSFAKSDIYDGLPDGRSVFTQEEFLSMLENLPSGVRYSASNIPANAQYLMGSAGYAAFVNNNKFDKTTFMRFLDHIITMPDKPLYNVSYEQYQNSEILTAPVYLSTLADFAVPRIYFGDSDIAVAGAPVTDISCNGVEINPYDAAYAIFDSCDNPELAWEYIRAIYLDEETSGLPRTDAELERMRANAANKHLVAYESGYARFVDELPIALPMAGYESWVELEMTDADWAWIEEILDNSGMPLHTYKQNRDINSLICEEVSEYLSDARGCSVSELADICENRVKVYLSERE